MKITRKHDFDSEDLKSLSKACSSTTASLDELEDLDAVDSGPYDVGDQFVIEIGDVVNRSDGKPLYCIKGFNALVFDQEGLKRLKQHSNSTFSQPLKTASYLLGKGHRIENLIALTDEELWGVIHTEREAESTINRGDVVEFRNYSPDYSDSHVIRGIVMSKQAEFVEVMDLETKRIYVRPAEKLRKFEGSVTVAPLI